MGIIKTAMMTGAGLYAVNKIAKAAETRRTSPPPATQGYDNSRQQYLDNGAPQYYPGQGQGQGGQQKNVTPREFVDRSGPAGQAQQQRQPCLLTDENASSPLTYGYNVEKDSYYEIDARAAPAHAYAGGAPPQYQTWQPQQQQRRGFVEPDEADYDQSSTRGGNLGGNGLFSALAPLAQQALSGGKGKDFMDKFMSK